MDGDEKQLIATLENLEMPGASPPADEASPEVVDRLRDEYWQGVQEVPDLEQPAEVVQVLGFQLDDQRYGVELHYCRSIMRIPQVTRIPRCPPELAGVIAFRGEVFPLMDIRAFLGLPDRMPDRRSRIVLLSAGFATGALLVDRVNAIQDVAGPLPTPEEKSIYHHENHATAGRVLSVPALLRDVIERLENGGSS